MGVPGLWPFIKRHFGKKCICHFESNTKKYNFDYVYLDANGLLHAAAQKVFNYGAHKRLLYHYSNLSYEQKLEKTFELFFQNILEVVSMATPIKILYIAIDGPAPRAKQSQQKQRRFVAAKTRKSEGFDSNCISPGTEFMHSLSHFMYYRIRKHMNDNQDIKYKVIYSPPSVPGEGEHKIMEYIRELPHYDKNHNTHCMFGPDGDLIMLTLGAPVSKIHLFRESQFEGIGYYDMVNMSKIRNNLDYLYGTEYNRMKRTNIENAHDFIFIGFFVGNDFLPKIKMFYKLDDGLRKMLDSFPGCLTNSNQVCLDGFRKFVKILSNYEKEYLIDQVYKTPTEPKFKDETLLKHYQDDSGLDFEAYRRSYYDKMGITSEHEIHEICKNYYENLVWVYTYYTQNLPSWEMMFKYHYAPLMCDFSKYLDTRLNSSVIFDKSKPALQFEQLLSILPASSSNLLPEVYRSLMIDEDSILVKKGYYPAEFKIDYEGKRKDHEGIAILPFVDYSIITNVFDEFNKNVKGKWYKNQKGENSIFFISENYKSKFISKFGIINNCKINRKKI